MPNNTIHANFGLKYALEGRIVTMDQAATVINRGRIFVENGVITAIRPKSEGYADGFTKSDVIKSGGTLYPGMIELHNHLPYNILPYWVADKQYRNRAQWAGIKGYRINVTGPMQTLGKSPGFPEAIVRYVECKSMIGGVTTSQGLTLANSTLTKKVFHGLIRNVEETNEDVLPEALTRIADVEQGGAQAFLTSLSDTKTRLLHLSEGVDEKARSYFTNLQINDTEWAITDKLNGIHCTGLQPEDYKVLGDRQGSMTWSPMSNLVLYGGTSDVKAAKENKVLIALGSDWSPSGSKNLLEELKVAYLVSKNHEAGPIFTDEELVQMVTSNPAKILGWENVLGSLQVGMKADMLIVRGYQGNPYKKLINATEKHLLGVFINGVPRCVQKRILNRFDFDTPDIEKFKIENVTRYIYLKESDPENILDGISLKASQNKIASGLQNLNHLANQLENANGNPLLSAHDNPLQTKWILVPDMHVDADGNVLEESHLEWGAGIPFSELAEPLPLDKLTVIEDDEHFRRMSYHPLPAYVRKGLPGFYGRPSLSLSNSEYTLEGLKTIPLEEPLALVTFLKSSSHLSYSEKLCILQQAKIVLGEVYVHQILKQTMYAVNPLHRIDLMIRNMNYATRIDPDAVADDDTFHNELLDIFSSLRDLHTKYILPRPFRNRFAFLPFLIEEYYPTQEDTEPKYIITTYFENILANKTAYKKGVEVLYWNNIPIKKAIALNSKNQSGSNNEAQMARGLDTLTIRSLGTTRPPDSHRVRLDCYDPSTGKPLEMDFEWLVSHHPPHFELDKQDTNATRMSYGFDYDTLSVNGLKATLYGGVSRKGKPPKKSLWIRPTHYPDLMKGTVKNTDSEQAFAYIRIYSFAASNAENFVADFREILQQLQKEHLSGLILDIRGNGGGLITASELLLAHLTGNQIALQRAQFINSALTLRLCEKYTKGNAVIDLSDWTRSIDLSRVTGDRYSRSYPITRIENIHNLQSIFAKPKVLITDALCYSASDMFAAGFQDHALGKIIGTHANTGAGGANVWSHEILRNLFDEAKTDTNPLKPMPKGADLTVAVRRILRKSDEPIEDLGIVPDVLHKISKNDLLFGNIDLIRRAMAILLPETQVDLGKSRKVLVD
ncbi:Cytosine/adenosine deaminase [Pricia antarctica]|uniref:Cytosine/adenosine deaminase n=1 Tax=Pricia antarctica TaxID=641691 RepID=A0A1G6W7C9_9FLAO|nr:S41 family peptidase [Pricia antarctica]SDD61718.1 Cytosine/adenosine deaminase [Pricia antarctica]